MLSRPHRKRSAQAGFTLIESLIAVVVLGVTISLTVNAISSVSTYAASAREGELAAEALDGWVDTLANHEFADVFADFRGRTFTVDGLRIQEDDPDGVVGRILFPVDPADDAVLREDLDDDTFGLPFDLNLDGSVDGADHSGDYRLLPYRVLVEWNGPTGNRLLVAEGVLGGW